MKLIGLLFAGLLALTSLNAGASVFGLGKRLMGEADKMLSPLSKRGTTLGDELPFAQAGKRVLGGGYGSHRATIAVAERSVDDLAQILWRQESVDDKVVLDYIARGGNIGETKDGSQLIQVAALTGHSNVVRILAEEGAERGVKVDARGAYGVNAAMAAADRGDVASLRALADNGADLDAATKNGMSAILFAIFAGRTEAVQFLVDRGVKVNIKSDFGSPMDVAELWGLDEIKRILRKAGAEESTVAKGRDWVDPKDFTWDKHFQ